MEKDRPTPAHAPLGQSGRGTDAALRRQIAAFVALRFDPLGRISLQSHVDANGTDPSAKG